MLDVIILPSSNPIRDYRLRQFEMYPNAEYFQFMVSTRDVFKKFGATSENLASLYDILDDRLRIVEEVLA